VERYLERLDPGDQRGALELIYTEFCLAEAAGENPEVSGYLARFPEYAEALERLLGLHRACSPSLVDRWVAAAADDHELPDVGDAIGPFVMRRELGRGSFARVFLAEQANLENRLVVVKVTTRPTREPWLLARVRHAHIVEIVSHHVVNDGAFRFQLICMPFWGGATLSTVLAARRRRGQALSGADLLVDLDTVAASEYPAVHPARPAREILSGLSYDQAVAWIGARLAEALDHAFNRDVAHGDIKPSNILLSADGNPMLLDFNLAREKSLAAVDGLAHDPGGTLAYMAPERLWALTISASGRDDAPADGPAIAENHDRALAACKEASEDSDSPGQAAHLADIYGLGMVLLEAATGRSPGQPVGPVAPPTNSRRGSLVAAASAHATFRGRDARTLIGECELAGGRAIAPGLRLILERCLDPVPAGRYARAWELAQDLDRWRTDRPLVFTAEPFWRHTLPRRLRRHGRSAAVIAMAVSLLVAVPLTSVALLSSLANRQAAARFKLARLWDDPEARAYRFQHQQALQHLACDDSHFEAAARALKEYDVLGATDWRQRDDALCLSAAEREDLELWLAGHAYVYCRTLADRPASPDDWRRGLNVLDRISGSSSLPVLEALKGRLAARLGGKESPAFRIATRSGSQGPPSWVNDYLLGVEAECDSDSDTPYGLQGSVENTRAVANRAENQHRSQERIRRSAELALKHYRDLLTAHPGSYWGHYRAAAKLFGLGGTENGGTENIAEAAGHLQQCLQRRPSNPTLQGQLAACLMELKQDREALEEIEHAIAGAPDVSELYRTRAFISASRGQTSPPGLADDLQHFEVLRHILPRALWGKTLAGAGGLSWSRPPSESRIQAALDLGSLVSRNPGELDEESLKLEVDPHEVAARAVLAARIRDSGDVELAELEFGKILILDPEELSVRLARALLSIEMRRFAQAQQDLDVVFANPGLDEQLRAHPALIRRLHQASRQYGEFGKLEESRALARRVLDLALRLRIPTGESHFALAHANCLLARTDRRFVPEAANQLYLAMVANPVFRDHYRRDSAFDAVRAQIDRSLGGKDDPAELHRRRPLLPLAQAR
jgi:serine/threonine protein kinase/thioredoxin-like negative regulator of GroEL